MTCDETCHLSPLAGAFGAPRVGRWDAMGSVGMQ